MILRCRLCRGVLELELESLAGICPDCGGIEPPTPSDARSSLSIDRRLRRRPSQMKELD